MKHKGECNTADCCPHFAQHHKHFFLFVYTLPKATGICSSLHVQLKRVSCEVLCLNLHKTLLLPHHPDIQLTVL